ncbi:glycosyltransferase [uncultured Alistipes sp.]|uniref:glycosyltransferase n=1 Tax=uncultured Alistipes sp. TaxID=538949 RepID=UPI002803FB82|nr:glycosyltransferase [uncultured Alistipes sp.]
MRVRTVAFYNWRYPYGGGEVVTFNLARFFRAAGLRVLLYTGKLDREKLLDQDSAIFEFQPLPQPGNFRNEENENFLAESLRQEQVDVIIVQGVMEFPFARIHETTSCKIIFCLHNKPFWEVEFIRAQPSSEIPHPTFARRLEFLLLRKPVYYLTPKLWNRTVKSYGRMLPSIDRCLLLCEAYRRDFDAAIASKFGEELVRGKTAAILNPLTPAVPGETIPKQKIILYVGRLVRTHKRVDRLLRIWQKIESHHPDWQLQIVGEGEERPALEKLARRLRLQRIHFLGYRSDMPTIYRTASFICLTSNFEGLPMSLMEGQQYGVIPVSFDSYAGIQEIAQDGKAGIIIPSYSLRRYASRLNRILDHPQEQEQLRRQALAAAQRYDPQVIGQQWLRLFEEL